MGAEFKILDVDDIPKEVKPKLVKYLCDLYVNAFAAKADIDEDCRKAKAMVDMKFVNKTDTYIARVNNQNRSYVPGDESRNREDAKAKMYNPFSARMVDADTAHLKKSAIPNNRELIKLNIGYHPIISEKLPEYKSCFEDGWEDYAKKTFIANKTVSNIMKAQRQGATYSNTVILHDYDPDEGFVFPQTLNFMNFAVFPKKDNPNKNCAMIYRSHIAEDDLRKRADISEGQLDELMPSSSMSMEELLKGNNNPDEQEASVGNIKIWTFFLPVYKDYYESDAKKREKYVLRNALIVMGVNDVGTSGLGTDANKISKTILKVVELPNRCYNPFQFSTFSVSDVDEPYARPKLMQYRGHQNLLNQLFYAFSYAVPLAIDPVKIVTKSGNRRSEDYVIGPGATLFEDQPNSIRFETYNVRLDTFLDAYQFLESDFGKGFGIPENVEGIPRTSGGDTTAREIEVTRQSGAIKLDYRADWQNEEFLQPFAYKFLLQTQIYIEQEIETAIIQYAGQEQYEEDPGRDAIIGDPNFWEFARGKRTITVGKEVIKNPCPLFRNWLIHSDIYSKLEVKTRQLMGQIPGEEGKPVFAGLVDAAFRAPGQGLQMLYEIITFPFASTDIEVESTTGEVTRKQEGENFQSIVGFLSQFEQPDPMTGMSKLQQGGMQLNIKEVARLAQKTFPTPSNELIIPFEAPPPLPVDGSVEAETLPGQLDGNTENVSEEKSQPEV